MKGLEYRFQVSSSTEGAEDSHIIFSGRLAFGGESYCWTSSVPAARLKKVVAGDPLKPGEFQPVTESGTPIRQGKALKVVLRGLAGPIIGAHWNASGTFCARVGRRGDIEYTVRTLTEGTGKLRGQQAKEAQAARESFHRQLQSIIG